MFRDVESTREVLRDPMRLSTLARAAAAPTTLARAAAAPTTLARATAASIRRLTSSAETLSVPVIRLPAIVFPHSCVSLRVQKESPHERPLPGHLTPALANEVGEYFGGKLAVLGDGCSVGVLVDLGGPTAGVDRETRTSTVGWAEGMAAHCVGGARLRLLQPGERTLAGGRLGCLAIVEDEPTDGDAARRMDDEAVVARSLLASGVESGAFELSLSTLDEELGMDVELALSHPSWLRGAALPAAADDGTALAFWIAARLPLTTALRHHVLSLTDPLKRLRDVVDALRLLHAPSAEARAAARKFRIVYDTAEASGCELEPPRPIVDWADAEQPSISRY